METKNIMTENEIIVEIEKSITDNYDVFTSMGVVNGLAGVSLFYYYLGNKELTISFIEKAIEGLNDSYQGTNIVEDIIDIGKLLNFYEEKGILTSDDIDFYFENYDYVVEELLMDSLKEDNLSPVSGILKYANYFIYRTRYSNKDCSCLFSEVLDKIEKLSHNDEGTGGTYWISNVERDGRKLIELGIKHGLMGIVDHLVSLYKIGFQKERVLGLIVSGLKYTSSFKLENKKFLFPFCSDNVPEAQSSSFGILYGDLGVAYGIYRAGLVCEIEEYKKLGTETLMLSTKVKDDNNEFITDANLFYGSLGIASFMTFIKKQLQVDFFDSTIDYWYNKTKEHKIHEGQWAGFDTTFNKFDINAQLSFSHGIVGVGIALLNFEKQLDFDFLKFVGYEF